MKNKLIIEWDKKKCHTHLSKPVNVEEIILLFCEIIRLFIKESKKERK